MINPAILLFSRVGVIVANLGAEAANDPKLLLSLLGVVAFFVASAVIAFVSGVNVLRKIVDP